MNDTSNEKRGSGDKPIGIRPNGTPYSVFIIDDSLTAREFLKRILLSIQCDIIGEAVNGEIAVSILTSLTHKPDFIFIDMEMSQMDGIETIKHIKPILKESRIIMVTSHAERDMVEKLVKLRVDGYIKKPFGRDMVLKKMALLTGRTND
jgi:YesN/AraC family two-component response regulator